MTEPSNNDTLTSDKILLERLRRGGDDAATSLYLRYAQRLHQLASSQLGDRLASRVDPEDVVQSVFRTFFRRAGNGQYDLPDGEHLWRLLLVISLNKVRALGAHHRAAKRNVSATSSLGDNEYTTPTASEDEQQDWQVLKLTIDDMLAEYPEAQREVIAMRISGFEIDDIVAKTNRSKRTVERTLQRFRQHLSSILQPLE